MSDDRSEKSSRPTEPLSAADITRPPSSAVETNERRTTREASANVPSPYEAARSTDQMEPLQLEVLRKQIDAQSRRERAAMEAAQAVTPTADPDEPAATARGAPDKPVEIADPVVVAYVEPLESPLPVRTASSSSRVWYGVLAVALALAALVIVYVLVAH